MTYTATYSPEDNKLRLYAEARLDAETFQNVKEAGFRWAPKQELFVAPAWSPRREDFLTELVGDIEPELTTMAERAAAKAERLDALAEKRGRQANAFQRAADEYAQAFDFGQPILVGHHSERGARKMVERRDAAQSKAVAASKAVNYWRYRADGVEAHANYKNDPGVRARRIKKLLAELRDFQRRLHGMEKRRRLWASVDTREKAVDLANHGDYSSYGTWRALVDGEKDFETVKAENIALAESYLQPRSYCRRWIEHTLNRLGYERDMLGPVALFEGALTPVIVQTFARTHGAEKPKAEKTAKGFRLKSPLPLPAHLSQGDALELTPTEWREFMRDCGYEVPAAKPKSAPILNFRAPGGRIHAKALYRKEPESLEQVEMTKADYTKIYKDARGVKLSACGRFRFKIACARYIPALRERGDADLVHRWVAVFLTDSKTHPAPEGLSVDSAESEAA